MALPKADPQPKPRLAPQVTYRAIAIGCACVAFLAWGGHYTRHIGHTTKMAQDHLPWGAVVPFILICVVANKLLEWLAPRRVLTRSELLTIFGMSLIASALPSYFMGHMMANIAAPYYFANVENRWADFIHPHLPSWSVVTDQTAAKWFFEGKPRNVPVPWDAWAMPLFWRLSLVGVVGFFGFCLIAILRKQWIEHERLTFPLMTLPESLTEREPRGWLPVGTMNQPLFWLGFGLVSFQIYWNMISYFVPLFPTIPLRFPLLEFGPHFPPIHARLYPLIIGTGYFMELDMTLSILVFHLLLTLEMGLFNRLGIEIGPTHVWPSSEFENWQGFGALCVIVPWSLWMARGHLRAVWRKAWTDSDEIDDSGEFLSYRTALIGLVGSALFICAWCVSSGMSPFVTAVFFALLIVIWMGITRLSIEGGLISSRTMQAQFATYRILGVEKIPPQGLVGFALTETWHHDIKTILLTDLANASYLFRNFRAERRRLVTAVGLAITIVVCGSAYYQVTSSYETGAYNYGGIYGPYVQNTFDTITKLIRDPYSLKRERALIGLIGGATTIVILGLRYVYPAFPLHPIGFAASTAYPVNRIVFSFFWAWLTKLIILRVGGIAAYRRGANFFLGMMIGYFVGVGVSFVVDCIWFPERGHSLALY
ncbi:MAG: hypothetical protein CME19_14310 [Gemmatimonadetes bacterium]|nr:hypothetical protein [Gemmatimonadota bacterium]